MEAKNIGKSCKLTERVDHLPTSENLARSYKLAERIAHLPRSETFITLKDHKDSFSYKPSCRLINPSKK